MMSPESMGIMYGVPGILVSPESRNHIWCPRNPTLHMVSPEPVLCSRHWVQLTLADRIPGDISNEEPEVKVLLLHERGRVEG
jgi:hypothetical protein